VLSLGAGVRHLRGLLLLVPKMTGKMYNEFLGKAHFFVMFVGVNLIFFPQHFLGLDGMPRRYPDYPDAFAYWNYISTVGYMVTVVAMGIFFLNIIWSMMAARRPGQSVGRGCHDARMDAVEPAALSPIRSAAEDRLGASGRR
jgi:cytochrome c oxidase subunit 1